MNTPRGTRVARCVEEAKKEGGIHDPHAIFRASSGQSYRTGKPPKGVQVKVVNTKKRGGEVMSKKGKCKGGKKGK